VNCRSRDSLFADKSHPGRRIPCIHSLNNSLWVNFSQAFCQAPDATDSDSLTQQLLLQSVLCHRGTTPAEASQHLSWRVALGAARLQQHLSWGESFRRSGNHRPCSSNAISGFRADGSCRAAAGMNLLNGSSTSRSGSTPPVALTSAKPAVSFQYLEQFVMTQLMHTVGCVFSHRAKRHFIDGRIDLMRWHEEVILKFL
jgi:hypothetical protein